MEAWERELYLLNTQQSRYKKKLKESLEIINETLAICEAPYISFSCGKDSSVMAHMILAIDNTIPLRFLSSGETRLVLNVDDIIQYFEQRGADVQEILVDRVFSEEWQDATWDEQRKAGRGDLNRLNEGGFDCIFMGLRAEESPPRRLSLYRHQTEGLPMFTYRYSGKGRKNMIRCCPLARWTTLDIGGYILQHDIPYLKWYEHQGFEGRTTARLTGDAVRNNVLVWMKQNDPNSFNRLAKRFPEFKMFV